MENVTDTLVELLVRSEQRIDATNKMICEMSVFRNYINKEYCKHIDDLAGCRDKLLDQIVVLNEQINELIKVNKEYQTEIRTLNNERARLYELISNMSRQPNIEIKR